MALYQAKDRIVVGVDFGTTFSGYYLDAQPTLSAANLLPIALHTRIVETLKDLTTFV